MNSYLRRLASNAIKPSGSIHPMVGSLFAGPKNETVLPVLEEENVAAMHQLDGQAARAQDVPPVRLHESDSSPSRADHPNAWPEIMPAKREGLEAFAIRVVQEHVEPSRDEQPYQRSEPDSQPKDPQPKAIPSNLYQPLITETARRWDAPQQIVLKSSNPLSDRTAPSEREPDEIQIHIGRIEVTAAPPPVSRPQTKPARKSLSLDDYLKRGRRG